MSPTIHLHGFDLTTDDAMRLNGHGTRRMRGGPLTDDQAETINNVFVEW